MKAAMAPADSAVRERALDPTVSFIVQAPAGSGKTELLTRRFLRLLAVVERPEEILAITFTRKAAAEMRKRILEALLLGLQDQAPAEDHLAATWRLAKAALAADARHGWRLATNPARLKIQTIDALNHTLARQLPILASTGGAIRIADDSEPLYAEAVLRVIEHLGSDTVAANAVERLVRHLDNRLDVLTILLTDLLKRRDHWLDLDLLQADRTQLRQRLESAIEAAVVERLDHLAKLWPHDTQVEVIRLITFAGERLRAAAASHALLGWEHPTRFPRGQLDDLTAWTAIAHFLLVKDKAQWRKTIDRNSGFPPEYKEQKQSCIALLERLDEEDSRLNGEVVRRLHEVRQLPFTRYTAEQWAALESLLEVLRIAVAELTLVFRERAEADHVAAALAGRQALGSVDDPTDLALQLDYRLKHLLVDEFQDTSRSQVRLLRLLTAGWMRGDGRSLFLVGDPMQSIYRFREADVGLFLKLQREGLGDLELQVLTLTVNFRSTQPVIDWINQVFCQVLPQQDDPERGAVRFTPGESRPEVPLHGGVYFHALVGSRQQTQTLEAQRVVQIVAESRRRNPACRIAILVPTRSHLTAILPALQAQGFRYQAVEIDRLRDRSLVQDLMALTRALVHLADRTAWLATLRAPWCGLTLRDLYALAADSANGRWGTTTIWNRLTDRSVVSELSPDGQQRLGRVQRVLKQALKERGRHPLRDWIERAWLALGGPAATTTAAELADAEAFFTRLDRLQQAGDLEDVARLEDEIADLYAVPDANERTAGDPPVIEIMTLHKAKGLQFDTVILPGLERRGARDGERLLRWLELPRADDGPALLLGPLSARDDDPDPLYKWLKEIEKERAAYERGRQLYVGATRAISELHLIGAAQLADKKGVSSIRTPEGESFLKLLWPLVAEQFEIPAHGSTPSAAPTAGFTSLPLRRWPLSWSPSVAGLGDLVVESVTPVIEGVPQPEFDWAGETSRHVGTLVHREIERLSQAGSSSSPIPDMAELRRFERELAELGVPLVHRASAAQRIATALANLQADERGRWLLAGPELHREATSELALSGYIQRTFVNGVIDRTFVDEDGSRWIVDFKTSAHSGSGLDEFLDSEVDRYRPQLSRYAELMRAWRPGEPIRAALYYPLLKAWREVEV